MRDCLTIYNIQKNVKLGSAKNEYVKDVYLYDLDLDPEWRSTLSFTHEFPFQYDSHTFLSISDALLYEKTKYLIGQKQASYMTNIKNKSQRYYAKSKMKNFLMDVNEEEIKKWNKKQKYYLKKIYKAN